MSLPGVIYFGDQFVDRQVFAFGNILKSIPEFRFHRNAGLMPVDVNAALFHLVARFNHREWINPFIELFSCKQLKFEGSFFQRRTVIIGFFRDFCRVVTGNRGLKRTGVHHLEYWNIRVLGIRESSV